MLYVSTRNKIDTYTAYRALHEGIAPDGGCYVPFRMPVFSPEEIAAMRTQSCCDTIAQVLNLFFGLRLTGPELEILVGRTPFRTESMAHKLQMVETWRNPEMSAQYLLDALYGQMTENVDHKPIGWARIGIWIALLFGLLPVLNEALATFDIAVNADDYSMIAAICIAKCMGFPAEMTVCSCVDDSNLWDLLNRGECDADSENPNAIYWEAILQATLGADAACMYFAACSSGKHFYMDELQQSSLQELLFASVVSGSRLEAVKSSIQRTNAYVAGDDAALAFGGLQDYRSVTGLSKETLILSLTYPER